MGEQAHVATAPIPPNIPNPYRTHTMNCEGLNRHRNPECKKLAEAMEQSKGQIASTSVAKPLVSSSIWSHDIGDKFRDFVDAHGPGV